MKANYLDKYFKENNGLVERLTIKNKIISRIICFIICSIIYPIVTAGKRYNQIHGDEFSTNQTYDIINIVMIFCYIIAGIGLLWIILELLVPSKIHKFTSKLTFSTKKKIFNFVDWSMILPICACIAVTLYSYVFLITPVSGISMMPTIQNKENILVTYYDKIDTFDVVVLKVTPEDNFNISSESYYLKRIIGLPGQTVTWTNKELRINGEIVEESFFPDDFLDSLVHYTPFDGVFRYKKDGKEQPATLVIPEGYYFVMGDNRNMQEGGAGTYYDCSKDSRVIGLIPKENIIGKAKYHFKGICIGKKIV